MPVPEWLEEMDTRYEGGSSYPALNIKVYEDASKSIERMRVDEDARQGEDISTAWLMWLEDELERHPERYNGWWDDVCASHFDDAKELAVELWGNVNVYSAGRSGGWLYITGMGTKEEWEARYVECAECEYPVSECECDEGWQAQDTSDLDKWPTYAEAVEAMVKSVPDAFIVTLYINDVMPDGSDYRLERPIIINPEDGSGFEYHYNGSQTFNVYRYVDADVDGQAGWTLKEVGVWTSEGNYWTTGTGTPVLAEADLREAVARHHLELLDNPEAFS